MTSMQARSTSAPTASAHAVAPHVARRVARLVGEDRQALAEVLALLDPEQLAGTATLPDPLPVTPGVRAAVDAAGATGLDAEARLVLLTAGVLVLDRVDVLLGATDLSVDRLLAPPLSDHLLLTDGRFRLDDPRLRAVVHADADLSTRTRAHAAASAALERVGEPRAARWHAALSTLAGDPALADGLVGHAECLLARGGACAAHVVAREATNHGTGAVRARAFLVAGQAALFSGHLHDAMAWFDRVASTGVDDVRHDAEVAADAVAALTEPERGTGDGSPGVRLARLVAPVARAAVSAVDRAVLVAVVEALARIDLDPQEADAVLARALVTAMPAGELGGWDAREDVLSPLAEAHLRVTQALVLLRGGDDDGAGSVLVDAAGRLPVAHAVGGLGGVVARCVTPAARRAVDGLGAALQAVGPDPVPAALAACRSVRRGAPPVETVAGRSLVVDAARACVPRPGAGPGGGDVWDRWAGVLTVRELDVARLVAEGLANKQVADRLCVSVRTVEVHLGRVFRKVGVASRGELTARVLTHST